MKFIQLLSTIASLAIFATAPGVSAAGLRARVDRTEAEEASGRRKLYVKYALPKEVPGMSGMHYGMPGTVPGMPTGPLVGPINTPSGMGGPGGPGGFPGMPGTMGVPRGEYASGYYNDGSYDYDNYGDNYDYGYDNDWDHSGHSVNGYERYMNGDLP